MEDDFQIEFMSLPLGDLQDHYGKLFERYRQMRDDAEADTQRIYELKRNLETAYAAETYLSQEIDELMQTLASIEKESKGHTRAQTELEDLRRQHRTLTVDYTTLQQDYAALNTENAELRKQLETAKSAKRLSSSSLMGSGTEELTERIADLEGENFALMQKLEDFQENAVKQTMALAERESNIEILRDQVTCLEENLRSKRDDLEEKTTLLESTQEQLADVNSRLAMLESKPEGVDRKGNSLFAEVDDQRQAMKKLLAAQKKSYIDMKKVFHDSQSEVRRLKRENIAMHTELRECSSIFCAADRTYQDKLNERIHQLLNQVEGLEKKLSVTHDRLRDLATDKGVAWIDSMLNFCKQETDDLKKQLHAVRIQKASLEEQLRNVQQEMTRWRFEALKTRCVLLDRENILNENGLPFKAVHAMELKISQKDQEKARPRIVHGSPGAPQTSTPVEKKPQMLGGPLLISPLERTSAIASTSPNILPNIQEENLEKVTTLQPKIEVECLLEHTEMSIKQEDSDVSLPDQNDSKKSKIKVECKENIELPLKEEEADSFLPDQSGTKKSLLHELTTDNNSLTKELKIPPTKCAKKTPPGLDAPPGRSILSKKRDPLATKQDSEKNVQFSSQDPTVHEISANVSMGQDTSSSDSGYKEGKHKAYIKQMRTKSNVIVRRVIMPSKRETT
ncbi:protein Spindly [Anastrepha ludens]|uniref:protein Spindly n=1 Tax=Anastrepha ludens TaxID=28586 RepID=UPI0023B05574|nr:protein Spindly [Anastrepha ludens]XP_053955559.1 protein Spindly [Anastrepha ludens]